MYNKPRFIIKMNSYTLSSMTTNSYPSLSTEAALFSNCKLGDLYLSS